ncbi:MAG: hypothetical protein U5L11_01185 [Arhodomonas sp.]|nr:hypothetical protein [Arhodomonas sp.]
MTGFYDELETRSAAARAEAMAEALPRQVRQARERAPHYAERLADVDPAGVTNRDALAAAAGAAQDGAGGAPGRGAALRRADRHGGAGPAARVPLAGAHP